MKEAASTLKEKTAKGLLWGGISNGVQQLLNLVFGIFLARLLTPADYGMVGMLTIFSLIASTLQDSGFTAALTNKKEIKHEDYNAVFWFSLFMGISLYLLLFFCAPLIADFFHQPALIPLARYSFLGFVISSTGTAQNAYIFRNLMVRQKALSVCIGLFVSGIVGISLAYCGFSYWGIATQSLTYVAIVNGSYWIFSPWRPSLHLNFKPLKGMISFSYKLLITNIFNHLNNNIFAIILGKFYKDNEKEVGYYNQANKWNYLSFSLVNGMVGGIAQPVLAQVADDRDRQLRIFRKMIRFTAFVSFPAMLGLSLISTELICITITEKWLKSAEILQLLCLYGAFIPIVTLYTNLIISKGKSNIYMWNTIILGVLQLLVLSLIHAWGLRTMIITYVSLNIGWILVWHYFVQKEINYRLIDLIHDLFPFLAIAGGTMVATYFITLSIDNLYLLFVSKIAIAAFIYIVVMGVSGSVTFKESVDYLLHRKK